MPGAGFGLPPVDLAMSISFSCEPPDILPARLCRRLARAAEDIARMSFLDRGQLSILVTDDCSIEVLNRKWRKKSGPTNVLAFPLAEPGAAPSPGLPLVLGEVIISAQTAAREAADRGECLYAHLLRLLVHGFLHLNGLDHERSAREAAVMQVQEDSIFTSIKKRRYFMPRLAVNVDHVATMRQARCGAEPDPVTAAAICELAGARGIVVHLREDRRHIQDRDLRLLRQTVKTRLNLEMAATEEMLGIAREIRPDFVTLVPEKRRELTTEGGLDVAAGIKKISMAVKTLSAAGIPVSLFVDPDFRQIDAALDAAATYVEIHTGRYSDATDDNAREEEFRLLEQAAEYAAARGLLVNAGHGLDYRNVRRVAALDAIQELSIGHALVARALYVGLDTAVREMLAELGPP